MEQVFTWTGFICLTILAIALTFYISVAAFAVAVKQFTKNTKVLKKFRKWYKTFPEDVQKERYVATFWDYEKSEFVKTEYLDEKELNYIVRQFERKE